MLKRIECVKVYWNDGLTEPSFYPDEKSAAEAVDMARNQDGRHDSTLRVAFQPVVKYLNLDNPSDRAWYESRLGRTFSVKRGRGRPRKTPVPAPAVPKARKPHKLSSSETFNPLMQAAGRKGGLASAGVPRVWSRRRPHGSVGLKDMTVQQKRAYWRWAAARKRQRDRVDRAAGK